MERVDLAAHAEDLDRQVALTLGIDRFCSSSAWILAASEALMPPRVPFAFRGDHGYFAAATGIHPAGFPYVEPLELAWGLAAPVIGADADALVEEIVPVLVAERAWRLAIFAGLAATGPQLRALERTLPARWERRAGTPTVRHVASLDDGIDGFLGRRSRELRKSLRRSLRAMDRDGITFEEVRAGRDDAAALYARIQAVEQRSWKARDGVGISEGPMRAFYELMLPRLCQLGQQRTVFARAGDRDVGYILGAVLGHEYRGLQFSYDHALADVGLGGLLQYHQILGLIGEGVTRYDLGTEMDYKRRWAEDVMITEMLIVVR